MQWQELEEHYSRQFDRAAELEIGACVAHLIGEDTFLKYWWNDDPELVERIDADAPRLYVLFNRPTFRATVRVEGL